jgi:hypothetical protein
VVGLGQHRERGQRHQQRVAVGLGARRRGIADGSTATAGAVVDDDRLAEDSLQRLCDGARRKIRLAAGRKRHDHGDVARGIGLRESRARQHRQQRQCGSRAQDIASIHGRFPPVFLFRCQPSVTVRKNKPRGGINEALSMFRPVRNAPLGSPLPPREWSDE